MKRRKPVDLVELAIEQFVHLAVLVVDSKHMNRIQLRRSSPVVLIRNQHCDAVVIKGLQLKGSGADACFPIRILTRI